MDYRLGVDVGGTNTDAAILDENLKVVGTEKSPSTDDVQTGIKNVIEKVLNSTKVDVSSIKYSMLGTTMSTNAIVERKELDKVGYIRIGRPATTGVDPFIEWPDDLQDTVEEKSIIVHGGHEYDGRTIDDVIESEVRDFCQLIKGKVSSIAIAGVFSPVNNDQEEQVAKIVKEELGDSTFITCSYQIGGLGLLERENSTILNSSLKTIGHKIVSGFSDALKELKINSKTYFSQNDGTLMSGDFTEQYPILTIGCGPTNSIRGAFHLSGLSDALVLDVGGTTTDIGVLVKTFPRQSALSASIGEIETNFRMPDILSIGIGGGTIVRTNDENESKFSVGPDSVGYELTSKSQVFGGDTLTATDIVSKLGIALSKNADLITQTTDNQAKLIYDNINETVENALDRMKTSSADVPLILTGGGSILIKDELKGISQVVKPDHYDAANAVGAALGQVSGETNRIYSLDKIDKEQAINEAKSEATKKAQQAGAIPSTIEITNVNYVPLAYLPGNAMQIKVKAIGDLAF